MSIIIIHTVCRGILVVRPSLSATMLYLSIRLRKQQPREIAQTMDMITGVDSTCQNTAWSVVKGRLSSTAIERSGLFT